jgi:hypothetical protein
VPLQLVGVGPAHLEAEPSGRPQRRLEQAGLPDPGLAFEQEAAPGPAGDRLQRAGQLAQLAGAAEQEPWPVVDGHDAKDGTAATPRIG